MPCSIMNLRRSWGRTRYWPPAVRWAGSPRSWIQFWIVSGDTRQYRATCPVERACIPDPRAFRSFRSFRCLQTTCQSGAVLPHRPRAAGSTRAQRPPRGGALRRSRPPVTIRQSALRCRGGSCRSRQTRLALPPRRNRQEEHRNAANLGAQVTLRPGSQNAASPSVCVRILRAHAAPAATRSGKGVRGRFVATQCFTLALHFPMVGSCWAIRRSARPTTHGRSSSTDNPEGVPASAAPGWTRQLQETRGWAEPRTMNPLDFQAKA